MDEQKKDYKDYSAETKRVRVEVEIPLAIYAALIENKLQNQENIMNRVKQAAVGAFYAMYHSQSVLPSSLRQYFEATYGKPPELPKVKKTQKNNKE